MRIGPVSVLRLRQKGARCSSFSTAPGVPDRSCANTPSGPTGERLHIRAEWQRRRYLQRQKLEAIRRPRNGRRGDEWVAVFVEDLLESFIAQRLSQNRSAGRDFQAAPSGDGKTWTGRSIHQISKRDVVEVISAIEQRGTPIAANKTLKSIKTFLPRRRPRRQDKDGGKPLPVDRNEVKRENAIPGGK